MSRLAAWWKPILAISLVLFVFACGGGGCSSCAGCGITPIPGAFPLEARIPNAAQVRLTDAGIAFVEDNIDSIVSNFLGMGLDFAIPATATSASGFDINVCPAGDCSAHIEIDSLDLTPTAPNTLHAEVHAFVDTRDAAGARRGIPIGLRGLCVFGACLVNTTCSADIDTRRADPPYVGLITDINFNNETEPARAGYTAIEIANPTLNPTLTEDMVEFGSCSGVDGAIINLVSGLLDSAIGDQLCTTRGETGCPTNTCSDGTAADAICHFAPPGADGACTGTGADNRCVPMLLGTDGRGDLGDALLGGFSPGTHAPIQFVLASGGEGEAVNSGMSLFMIGGMQSWDRAFSVTPGHNACVPRIDPPPLPTIARADAFRGNTIPGLATTPHVGIGLSEDYLDYAGYGLFDAGALCIGTGTSISQQLSTGLVSALIRSLASFAFPIEDAPIAIALRPQQPPDFEIGTTSGAPLLTVVLPELQMDFYVWSTERYVRAFTFQSDLVIEIGLTVEAGQLVPSIESLTAMNSVVTNAENIADDPADIASALETVLTSFASMLGSAISPFDLPAIMGFNLVVPDGGIRGVDDSGEVFLGIFANLELAGGAPLTTEVNTSIELADLTLDRDSMTLEHWNEGEGNSVWAYLEADGPIGVDYEYSYRIDGGHWHAWTRDRRILIEDDTLLLQAEHVIEARARVVGEPLSVDRTPGAASLLVDILPPSLSVEPIETGFLAHARDIITDEDQLEFRWRLGGEDATWTEWSLAPELVLTEEQWDIDGDLDIEVRDGAGNVQTTSLPLIRGIPNPAGGGACGCRVTSPAQSNGPLAALASLAVIALVLVRRRRGEEAARRAGTFRRAARLALTVFGLALAVVASGCDCAGPTMTEPCGGDCRPAAPPGRPTGDVCCPRTNMCVDYDVRELCDPGFTCPVDEVVLDASCGISCGTCEELPELAPGILALDLDYVDSAMGRFVSGYSPGIPTSQLYGDLVFGEVTATGSVNWEIVDGAPAGPITNSVSGWRGGVSAEGDDVGRWTALADSGTTLYIAYYDVTNGDLKIAVGAPGAWDIHTIDETGDSGRYASIALAGGVPVVSYLRAEAQTDGTIRTSVRVARASSATPGATTDWTTSEVAGAATPCRAAWCGTGQVCLETGSCVATGTGCSPACGADQACVAGSCTAVVPDGWVEDVPPVYGAYTRLAVAGTGLALVWYDRATGNMYGASSSDGTTWGTPFLIDGYTGPSVGDSGLGASIFVDTSGTWHVTYVNGTDEELRYVQVTGGAVTVRERIDDGSTDGTTPHTDGRHIVGDDSSVVVTATGEVRVAYQDSTSIVTMLARRTAPGTWTVEVLDDVDANGFWVEQELSPTGGSSVASWWRQPDRATTNGVRITLVP